MICYRIGLFGLTSNYTVGLIFMKYVNPENLKSIDSFPNIRGQIEIKLK